MLYLIHRAHSGRNNFTSSDWPGTKFNHYSLRLMKYDAGEVVVIPVRKQRPDPSSYSYFTIVLSSERKGLLF